VRLERRALRDTVVSLACRACLVLLGHRVRRVHLVPQEPTGNPAPPDPEARLVSTEQLVLLASLEHRDPADLRERKGSEDPRVRWASQDHQVPLASLWATMQLHCLLSSVKALQRQVYFVF
jgi:hypothetical protein